uniref:Ig-like domain-containing protein n=1 Tax=Amphiprion percula TaxID=161767 RepID=A0A3P8RN36_AMPPE
MRVTSKFSRKLIDCKAEGEPTPTITWIMPDNIFLKAPYFGSRINVHHNGTLEIRNVRPTDTAEFICMARNDGGEAVMVVQLEVTSLLKRPIFKNPFNERVVARFGKTTVLNCSADGHPTPEIIWTLPNGTRFTGGSHRSELLHPQGTLIIQRPKPSDSGTYKCLAKNHQGTDSKVTYVLVHSAVCKTHRGHFDFFLLLLLLRTKFTALLQRELKGEVEGNDKIGENRACMSLIRVYISVSTRDALVKQRSSETVCHVCFLTSFIW